jgi:predicted phosphodiesterase
MRVAVLCDVHGNLPALEAVLAEVASLDVDRIVCGGDVVAGPFPRECLDALVRLDAVFVRGNADRESPRAPGHGGGSPISHSVAFLHELRPLRSAVSSTATGRRATTTRF